MIDKNFFYAVVGASNDKTKYGYKVLENLINAEYKVIPINPNEKEILGKKVYPTLGAIKKNIDVAIFVTQAKITEKILQEVKKTNIKKVRLQPGAESNEAIDFCKKNNIECIHNACIMITKK